MISPQATPSPAQRKFSLFNFKFFNSPSDERRTTSPTVLSSPRNKDNQHTIQELHIDPHPTEPKRHSFCSCSSTEPLPTIGSIGEIEKKDVTKESLQPRSSVSTVSTQTDSIVVVETVVMTVPEHCCCTESSSDEEECEECLRTLTGPNEQASCSSSTSSSRASLRLSTSMEVVPESDRDEKACCERIVITDCSDCHQQYRDDDESSTNGTDIEDNGDEDDDARVKETFEYELDSLLKCDELSNSVDDQGDLPLASPEVAPSSSRKFSSSSITNNAARRDLMPLPRVDRPTSISPVINIGSFQEYIDKMSPASGKCVSVSPCDKLTITLPGKSSLYSRYHL